MFNEMMKDMVVYIPDCGLFFRVAEGNGMNLNSDDEDEGYVDYLYYEMFKMDNHCETEEYDGGIQLLRETVADKFKGNSVLALHSALLMVFDEIPGYIPIDTDWD